jgi:glycosyltransferase involved in cell wall biosynthesis
VERFAAPVDEAARRQWRERLGLRESDRVVGTMARLVASKGVDRLIEAFADVRASQPDAKLLIVGDGEDRPRLAQLAHRLNLSQAVCFTGAVTDTRTPRDPTPPPTSSRRPTATPRCSG